MISVEIKVPPAAFIDTVRHAASYEFSRIHLSPGPVDRRIIGKIAAYLLSLSGCLTIVGAKDIADMESEVFMDPYTDAKHDADNLGQLLVKNVTQQHVAHALCTLEMIAELNGADLLCLLQSQLRTERAMRYVSSRTHAAREACTE